MLTAEKLYRVSFMAYYIVPESRLDSARDDLAGDLRDMSSQEFFNSIDIIEDPTATLDDVNDYYRDQDADGDGTGFPWVVGHMLEHNEGEKHDVESC